MPKEERLVAVRHRRREGRYELVVEVPDPSVLEGVVDLDEEGRVLMTWPEAITEVPVNPADASKGTRPAYKTRAEYEEMQVREAALLIRHYLGESAPAKQAGAKASGEGKKL